jgi:hypothetical protein
MLARQGTLPLEPFHQPNGKDADTSEDMPVILITQETEIRRIMVRCQLQVNSSGDPILKKPMAKKG